MQRLSAKPVLSGICASFFIASLGCLGSSTPASTKERSWAEYSADEKAAWEADFAAREAERRAECEASGGHFNPCAPCHPGNVCEACVEPCTEAVDRPPAADPPNSGNVAPPELGIAPVDRIPRRGEIGSTPHGPHAHDIGAVGVERQRAPPPLISGSSTVHGLPHDIVHEAIRKTWPRIESCQREASQRAPGVRHRLVVKMIFEQNGAQRSADVETDEVSDRRLFACAMEAMRSVQLPATTGGIVIARHVLVLRALQ